MALPRHRQRVPQHSTQPEDAPSFGAWLRQRRRALDWTQAELAQRVGCARITVRRIEADELKPSQQLAELFAEHLGVPLTERKRWLQLARGLVQTLQASPMDTNGVSSIASVALPANRLAPFPNDSGHAQTHIDWGEAPDVSQFCGREAELAQLRQWVVDDHCRLVAVLGMGGQGKTVLATMAAVQVASMFACLIWRSLRNAPPVEELLGQCIQVVTNQAMQALPVGVDKRINLLIEYLQRHRCLLVFDNFETVLDSGRVGVYRPGYEGYGYLLQRLGEGRHQSCLLLTSREKPRELITLASATAPVRILALASLPPADCQGLLQGVTGSHTDWLALHQHYSGNPLALKIVAETIRELFLGNINDFLRAKTFFFGGIAELIAQQFVRLSLLEQDVMFWLAIEREPVDIVELHTTLVMPVTELALLEALQSLRQRSLVERPLTGFTLQNVVLEYLTSMLIDRTCDEITTGKIVLLQRYTLFKAQAKHDVQECQRTLLLTPIANRLVEKMGKQGVAERLCTLLAMLRTSPLRQPGYAGGNLLNLALYLGLDLSSLDLSNLAIWQADLRMARLHHTNCAGADFRTTKFRDTFGAIYCLAFSPNGLLLATGASDFQVRIWHVATQRCNSILEGHTQYVWGVAFCPQGQILASCSLDGTVRLWDVESGQCLHVLLGHTQGVRQVTFSPNGRILASAAIDGTVRLWNLATAGCDTVLRGHVGGVTTLAFSPDSQWLITGGDEFHLRLWAVDTGHILRLFSGHTNYITTVAFSKDGKIVASGSGDHTICLWDAHSGNLITTLKGHSDTVHSLAFYQDNKMLVSGSGDRTLRLWNLAGEQCVQILEYHTSAIWTVAINDHVQLIASAGDDKTICLWRSLERRLLSALHGYTGAVGRLIFIDNGQLLATAGSDGNIHLWRISNHQDQETHYQETLSGKHGNIRALVAHPADNHFASSGDDGSVRLWDMTRKQQVATLYGHSKTVRALAFHPCGDLLASAGDEQTIYLWDLRNKTPIASWNAHHLSIWSLAFSPHNFLLASAGMDPDVKLWNASHRQLVQSIPIGAGGNRALTFSPDGSVLAIASDDGVIRMWDVQNSEMVHHLCGHMHMVNTLAFSSDGTRLASAGYDKTILVWRLQKGFLPAEVPQVLAGHTNAVLAVAFHPYLPLIASCSMDKTVRIWDEESSTCLATLRIPRPYENMNITNVTGISVAQKLALLTLGAIDDKR